MKKIILILWLAAIQHAATAQKTDKDIPFLVKTFSRIDIKQVEAITAGGNISVQSITGDDTRLEVFISAPVNKKAPVLSKDEIQKRVDEFYVFSVDIIGDKIMATAKAKKDNMNWKQSLSISFRFFTNSDVTTQLKTSGGNIDLVGLSGAQNFSTSGGNLTIENIKGKIKGQTAGGNVSIKNANDFIDLKTSGGNMLAENCTGTINMATSGGNLWLKNLNGNIITKTNGGQIEADNIKGELVASTSGGNVELTHMNCNLTASTNGGNVEAMFNGTSKTIVLNNSGGRIDIELPAGKGYNLDLSAEKIESRDLKNFTGKLEDENIKGVMDGGGTNVTAHTSGKIRLTFR